MKPFKIFFLLIAFAVFTLLSHQLVFAEIRNRVVAIVNNEVITLYELNTRTRALTGLDPTELELKDKKQYLETRRKILDILIEEKIALLPEELSRKKQDLLMKYSIRVKVIPCAALFIRTPAVKILCEVHAGRQKRPLSLTYNPITRALDPLVCEGCGRSTTVISFCTARHALCSDCEPRCPVCGPSSP